MFYPQAGWSMWHLVERDDDEVVLTSIAVAEDAGVSLLAGDSIGRPTGVN